MKRLNVLLTLVLITISLHLHNVNIQQQRAIESLSIQIVMLRHQTNVINSTLSTTSHNLNVLSNFVMDNP